MNKFRVVFYENDEALEANDRVLEEIKVTAKNELEAEQKAFLRLSSDLQSVYNQVVAYPDEEIV